MSLIKTPAAKTRYSLAVRLKGPSSMANPIPLDSDNEEEVTIRDPRGRKRAAPAVKREASITRSVPDIYNASPRRGSPDTLNGDTGESSWKKVKLEDHEMAKLVAENAVMQRKINENNAKLALAASNYKSPTVEDALRDSIGDPLSVTAASNANSGTDLG